MTKAELVDRMAKGSGMTKRAAETALESALKSIRDSLKKGKKVTLVGFGTFSVAKRAARNGRNPQTGRVIRIPAAKVPRFKAGKDLKSAVKQSFG
ncbi:MAG: HU family DNA-binding protein [candidate division NC10 bacterium]|nr:HU family DNA-binding protein [candidate division NC10 bacterium]